MSSIFETYDCPRCGGGVPNDAERGAYPGALSRWNDRSVEVCSQCGQDEAMIQFAATMRGEGTQLVVHPTKGERPWVNPPAEPYDPYGGAKHRWYEEN